VVGIVVITRVALLIARRASTWTIEEPLGGRSPECVSVDLRRIAGFKPTLAPQKACLFRDSLSHSVSKSVETLSSFHIRASSNRARSFFSTAAYASLPSNSRNGGFRSCVSWMIA